MKTHLTYHQGDTNSDTTLLTEPRLEHRIKKQAEGREQCWHYVNHMRDEVGTEGSAGFAGVLLNGEAIRVPNRKR
jgi:hypothetical protein